MHTAMCIRGVCGWGGNRGRGGGTRPTGLFVFFDVSSVCARGGLALSGRQGVGGAALMFSPDPQPFKSPMVGGLLMAALEGFFLGGGGFGEMIYFDSKSSPAVLRR